MDDMDVDWFGISSDPAVDPAKKCAFCKDTKRNPLEDPDSESNSYATMDCRHRICGVCQKQYIPGQIKCPLCGSRVQAFRKEPPEYMALTVLNEVRKDVYKEWNLFPEDFPTIQEYEKYLEHREDVITELLYARTLDREARAAVEQKVAGIRAQFRSKYRDMINKNAARITEYRNQVQQSINAERKLVDELRKQIEREKIEEQMAKLRREEEKNDERLGTVRLKPTESNSKGRADEDVRTYMFNRNDPTANNGPPPTVVVPADKVVKPQVSDDVILRAGGLSEEVIQMRYRSEMKAGWDLFV